MGKKVKIGKQRRDKYYKLAKEAGFRSRAAFKLIQLNKRFEFLQNAKACVDLCAAPGGWMQVATQNMPVSSLVIGVDLVPIKPIANCISLQGDITTEKTRQDIRKELNNWLADCVLHDGAPNVGLNWVHDAFQQNCLTLSALKMATQVLKKGGTFVTKVFRSNDYSCLIHVFEKLFKQVHVWKPAASRLESAEIFVVCEKYFKPAKVPPELLDPKKVFADPDGTLDAAKGNPQTLLLSGRKDRKAKADGYDEGLAVFKTVDATTFIQSHNYLDILGAANKIVLDQDKWKESSATTPEVLECLNDIKVCGPRELRNLLRWRKSMRKILDEELKELEDGEGEDKEEPKELTADEIEDKELAEIDAMIEKASEEEKAALKKKKKKMLKAKAKLIKRRQLKMVIDGDYFDQEDLEVFSLKRIKRAKELAALNGNNVETPDVENEEDDEEGLGEGEWETFKGEGEEEEDNDSDNDSDNGLIITEESYLTRAEKQETRADKWFDKEEIAGLISDEDDENEMNVIEKHMKKQSGDKFANTVSFEDEDKKGRRKRKAEEQAEEAIFNDDDDSDADDEEEEEKSAEAEKEKKKSKFTAEMDWEEQGFEDDNTRASKREAEKTILGEDLKPKAKKRRLTPEELAMGEQLIYSSKSARDLEDWAWNRFANNDEGLPDWFVEDEKKHYKKTPPVTKEQVKLYKERLRELNARPCKKVAEAKARKQRKMKQKMDKARKRAEGVLENENLEHSEKVREMKKIYAQAGKKEKKKVELVRMTKGKKGTTSRPNGRYKLVDSRMKKDLRAQKKKEKTKGRGGAGKARSGSRRGGRR